MNLVQVILTMLTGIALLMLFASAERLGRRGLHPETTRRLVHAAGASAAALFPLYLDRASVVVLAGAFTSFLIVTRVRGSLTSVHGVRRTSVGALVFPLGLALALISVWDRTSAGAFAALTLALADPAAAIVGERCPIVSWRAWGGHKSLGGSLACFVTAALLGFTFMALTGDIHLPQIVMVAALVAIAETALGYGLDNLTVPVAAALLGKYVLGL